MPDGPLYPGPGNTRYPRHESARVRFKAITTALDIDGYTSHSLRHQFASEPLDDGMNIMDLSAVLGHADPSVTLRTYVHAMPRAATLRAVQWALTGTAGAGLAVQRLFIMARVRCSASRHQDQAARPPQAPAHAGRAGTEGRP
jgi:hypothetical protein